MSVAVNNSGLLPVEARESSIDRSSPIPLLPLGLLFCSVAFELNVPGVQLGRLTKESPPGMSVDESNLCNVCYSFQKFNTSSPSRGRTEQCWKDYLSPKWSASLSRTEG